MTMKKSETITTGAGWISTALFLALSVGLGITQWAAIFDWAESALNLPWVVSASLAAVSGFFPLLGNISGTLGAINLRGWPWWAAVLLFFGSWIFYWVILIPIGRLAQLAEHFEKGKES
jgi:hypothetical protein